MRSVVFLDRDGTINADHGFVHCVDQWEFLPGAIEGMRQLAEAGFLLAVVSNQSGVGRGMYSSADVELLHNHLIASLKDAGVSLAATAFCPHTAADRCDCRKPRTGLANAVRQRIGEEIDVPRSWTIGDKPSDCQFGAALGTRTTLLESRYWRPKSALGVNPDITAGSLLEAASLIIERSDG
jgi:D-glycero-D-manno-heptose 1,7-bisphosphate phosphatase